MISGPLDEFRFLHMVLGMTVQAHGHIVKLTQDQDFYNAQCSMLTDGLSSNDLCVHPSEFLQLHHKIVGAYSFTLAHPSTTSTV